MDATAINYDPNACFNDGSCVALVYGCTDSQALNYMPGAIVEDGSCLYLGCLEVGHPAYLYIDLHAHQGSPSGINPVDVTQYVAPNYLHSYTNPMPPITIGSTTSSPGYSYASQGQTITYSYDASIPSPVIINGGTSLCDAIQTHLSL